MMRTLTVLVLALTCGVAGAQPVAVPSIGRVLKVEVSGDATIAIVGLGSEQGIAKTATCKFVDAAAKPLAGDCSIIRVDMRTTTVKTNLSIEQIRSNLRVQLTMH